MSIVLLDLAHANVRQFAMPKLIRLIETMNLVHKIKVLNVQSVFSDTELHRIDASGIRIEALGDKSHKIDVSGIHIKAPSDSPHRIDASGIHTSGSDASCSRAI